MWAASWQVPGRELSHLSSGFVAGKPEVRTIRTDGIDALVWLRQRHRAGLERLADSAQHGVS
jgi:hypothetical protein